VGWGAVGVVVVGGRAPVVWRRTPVVGVVRVVWWRAVVGGVVGRWAVVGVVVVGGVVRGWRRVVPPCPPLPMVHCCCACTHWLPPHHHHWHSSSSSSVHWRCWQQPPIVGLGVCCCGGVRPVVLQLPAQRSLLCRPQGLGLDPAQAGQGLGAVVVQVQGNEL
jgi:hypothetical protein